MLSSFADVVAVVIVVVIVVAVVIDVVVVIWCCCRHWCWCRCWRLRRLKCLFKLLSSCRLPDGRRTKIGALTFGQRDLSPILFWPMDLMRNLPKFSLGKINLLLLIAEQGLNWFFLDSNLFEPVTFGYAKVWRAWAAPEWKSLRELWESKTWVLISVGSHNWTFFSATKLFISYKYFSLLTKVDWALATLTLDKVARR